MYIYYNHITKIGTYNFLNQSRIYTLSPIDPITGKIEADINGHLICLFTNAKTYSSCDERFLKVNSTKIGVWGLIQLYPSPTLDQQRCHTLYSTEYHPL